MKNAESSKTLEDVNKIGVYSKDSKAWRQSAEATYAGAVELFESDNLYVWFPAAVLGHHAIELFLKSLLIEQGHTICKKDVWGHSLIYLADLLAEHFALSNLVTEGLTIFDAYFDELRYPSGTLRVEGVGQQEHHLLKFLIEEFRSFSKL